MYNAHLSQCRQAALGVHQQAEGHSHSWPLTASLDCDKLFLLEVRRSTSVALGISLSKVKTLPKITSILPGQSV